MVGLPFLLPITFFLIGKVKGKADQVHALTFNLPTATIVAQPFNVIKWQLKFNPAA
jgi:hypothetical protein